MGGWWMPIYNKTEIGRVAQQRGFVRDTFEKVLRLKSILRYLNEEEYLTEVSTSVYEISNITAEKPLKIRCFQLFIIFDNVVPLYYLYF